MIEKIINIINDNIESLKLLNDSISVENDEINKLDALEIKINDIIESNIKILNLTEDDLINIENVSNGSSNNIKLYRIILRNKDFILNENLKLSLESLCEKIIIDIKKYLELNQKNLDRIKFIEDDIIKLKEYLNKLDSGYSNFESNDIDFIVNLLVESGVSQDEIIDLLKEISLYKTHRYHNNEEETDLMEETNLEESEVIKLFLSYGIDFKSFKEIDREEILCHGKIENIKEILEAFIKYNVTIKNNFLHLKSRQISRILIYSNAKNITKLFDFCILNKMTNDGKIDFYHLVNYPSRFNDRRRQYKRRNTPKEGGHFNIEESGCIDDFIKNYEFFKNEYLKLVGQTDGNNDFYEKIYLSKSSLFNISHEKILNTIKIFSKYGITSENYLKALSCFLVTDPEEVLDLCVELGILDYIKDNLTYIIQIDKDLFNEISIANRVGINCFGYQNRNSIYNTIKTALYYRRKDVKQYILENDLKFECYNLEDIFEEEELKIFKEFDTITLNNNVSSSRIDSARSRLIEKLENEYSDPEDSMVYNINGIRISKLKVARLYNSLKLSSIEDNAYSIVYMLTKNSIITENEFLMLYYEVEKIAKELKEEKRV